MRNLLSNPQIGLLFLVAGRDETLRVNVRAWVTTDPVLLEPSAVNSVMPRLAIGVEVQQAFLHCVKAFRRSRLWVRDTWLEPSALESIACVILDQIKPDMAFEEFERGVLDSDARLYV